MKTTTTKAAEQDPAESEQSESLPEGDLLPSEQRRQQPVPQEPHDFAANGDEEQHPQNRQWSQDNPSLSHGQPSCFREFVVDALQSLAQAQHRVPLAREQRVHADAGLGGHLLEAASFQLVRNKHLPLLFR